MHLYLYEVVYRISYVFSVCFLFCLLLWLCLHSLRAFKCIMCVCTLLTRLQPSVLYWFGISRVCVCVRVWAGRSDLLWLMKARDSSFLNTPITRLSD